MNNEYKPIKRESWMQDSATKSCINCQKSFTALLRRHHCRYCGLIFCKKCIFTKTCASSHKTFKKICDSCFKIMQKRENNRSLKHQRDVTPVSLEIQSETSLRTDSMSSSEAAFEVTRVFNVSETPKKEIQAILEELNRQDAQWEQIFNEFLWKRVRSMLSSLSENEEWVELLVNLIDCAVKSICPSVQYKGDKMDINNYIKIQRIIFKDRSFTNFISGLAFDKNLASKKMSKLIQSPRILVISKFSILKRDTSKLISMEKLIEQEDSLTNILLKKILACQPSLIICGKSLPQPIINYFTENNISVMVNVKNKLLRLVSRATGAKVLSSIDEINSEHNFMGNCSCFFQENRGSMKIIHFTGLNDRSSVGTIFISGPDSFELTSVKKVLKAALIEYRNIRIEKSLCEVFKLQYPQELLDSLHANSFVFKHFVSSQNAICADPATFAIEFYSERDLSLGEFLHISAEKTEKQCGKCKEPWMAHLLYYLLGDGRIKVSFLATSLKSREATFTRECKICGKFDKNPTKISSSLWEYSFYKFLNNFFINSSSISMSMNCKHNFFRLSKFNFMLLGIKILIEWEENPCYRVLSLSKETRSTDSADASKKLSSAVTQQTKKSSTNLIENLILLCKELLMNISNDVPQLEKKSNEKFWENIEMEVSAIMSKLTKIIVQLYELQPNEFSSPIDAETYRRGLFLEVCSIKASLNNLEYFVKAGCKKDKIPSNETFNLENERRYRFSFDEESEMFKKKSSTASFPKLIERFKNDDMYSLEDFAVLRRGNLSLSLGKNAQFIPVEEFDMLSIIAHAMNTNEYYDEVLANLPKASDLQMIESELLNCSEKHFQIQFATYSAEECRDLPKTPENIQIYGDQITFNVHMFYPRQFQIIRDFSSNHTAFLSSIYTSELKKEQLGKSKATFCRSYDKQFIIKTLEEKEFGMFKELAPNYFRHICNAEFHNMPSKLVRTLGCFRVYKKNHTKNEVSTEWVLLFENLSCVIPGEVKVYDLKGSFNKRRYVDRAGRTKMDRNFLEDFLGIPLTITREAKKLLDMSIWNDTLFLSKQNIVDYSLLLIVSENCRCVCFGIIDYIAKFTLEKAMERKIKKVVGTTDPTIAKPMRYKNRFRESIAKKFFIDLEE